MSLRSAAAVLLVAILFGFGPSPSVGSAASVAAARVDEGGYVVDAWGALHPFGGATSAVASGYWPGQDLARGVAISGKGGWVLDAYGGLHPFGGARTVYGSGYWPGSDLARAVAARPGGGGWVLDAYGGIHEFGGAPRLRSAAYWPGRDLARALVVRPGGGAWVVDAFGGLHPAGSAPAVQGTAYWPPFDVVRGAVADPFGRGGWTVDMWGGVHAFGRAPRFNSRQRWAGQDLARGAVADPRTGGGWVVDAYGGLHRFGGARTVYGNGYWPGVDLARGGSSGNGGSGGRAVPRPRLPVRRVVTYSYAVRGRVRSDLAAFVASVDATLADERGWAAAGFGFRRIPGGGDMIVWLSQASQVPSFGAPCDSFYSCRQGRNVIINDDRFAFGSPTWPGALVHYRQMVVNHEVGHWIGFGHAGCPGPGAAAPVMMQQSIRLSGCATNPWPLASELAAARRSIGPAAGGPIGAGNPAAASRE